MFVVCLELKATSFVIKLVAFLKCLAFCYVP